MTEPPAGDRMEIQKLQDLRNELQVQIRVAENQGKRLQDRQKLEHMGQLLSSRAQVQAKVEELLEQIKGLDKEVGWGAAGPHFPPGGHGRTGRMGRQRFQEGLGDREKFGAQYSLRYPGRRLRVKDGDVVEASGRDMGIMITLVLGCLGLPPGSIAQGSLLAGFGTV